MVLGRILEERLEERRMVHDNLTIACHGSGWTNVYWTGMRRTNSLEIQTKTC